MYKHDHSKYLAKAACVAITLCALTTLGSGSAQAQATAFDPNGTAAQLGPGAILASAFSMGNAQGFLASPTFTHAGTNTLTYTAQIERTSSTGFESATSNGMSTNFTAGTQLLNTFDGAANTITGPLQLDFSQGVTSFGFLAEDDVSDSETFNFSVFTNGSTTNPLNFTSGAFNNFATFDSSGNIIGGGKSVFLGAQATGANVITRVVVSSSSVAAGGYTGNSNDFVVGPASITAPVPEASTSVSCGAGVLLFAGLVLGARKRKGSRASQAAA